MRGILRTTRARRRRRRHHVVLLEQEQQRFTLDAVEAKVTVARDLASAIAALVRVGDCGEQPVGEAVAQWSDAVDDLLALVDRDAGGFRHRDDARNVLRPAAAIALLSPADLTRSEGDTVSHHERARA